MSVAALLLDDDRDRPRSLQTQLGMSDLGGCRRKAGYRLAGTIPSDDGGSMQAVLGTLLHEGIVARVQKAFPEALLEVEVEFAGILGHVDCYIEPVVTDYKTTSSRFLKTIKRDGPTRGQLWQISGYAAALIKQGRRVETVELVYLARDTGEEHIWSAPFNPQDVADALEWLALVRDTPLDMLPRDYQPDSPFCRGCPFQTVCWDGGVPDRDVRSVLYVEDPDASRWAEQLWQARQDKVAAEAREKEAKGALDALRPNDDGQEVVDVGWRLPLQWQVVRGRRTLDQAAVEADYAAAGGTAPFKVGAPSVRLTFVGGDE